MSMTSLPVDARASRPSPSVKPPVLASDILREEVAPRAPARTMIRIWLATFAAACALSAVAAKFGFGPHTRHVFEGSLATAGLAALGALVPAPYALRAILALIAGLALLVLGATDRGPLAPLGHEGLLPATAGLVLITALPASLLFRARYRAFRAARVILSISLAVAIPAATFAIFSAIDDSAPLEMRIANALLAAATATGFFGYMGEETTGGCGRWAAVVLFVYAGRVAVHALPTETVHDGYGEWGYLIAAAGTLAATTLAAFGFFQVLATLFADRAREVDVHRIAARSIPGERED